MLHLERKRPFISLRIKFMISFMLLITIPFLISGTITYTKYSSNVERDARNYTSQIAEQIRINLDRSVQEMERLTLTPFYDSGVVAILKNHSGPYQGGVYLTAEEKQKINLFISFLTSERTEIESILIFANDGSLFNNSEIFVKNYWAQDKENWMTKVILENGGLTILPPHTVYYYKTGPKLVVSLSRLIREPFTLKPIGLIKVDLSEEGFKKIFKPENFDKNINLYIYDKEGTLMYPSQVSPPPGLNKDQYLSASTVSKYTGMEIFGRVPLKELKQEAKNLINFTLMIAVISLLVAYLMSIIASSSLVKPIRHLQKKMVRVRNGSFKEKAIVSTNDEIGQLTEDFNGMLGEIDRLVREVYQTKIREREAELAALQSQMNPHFLYNTLESINMMAVRSDNMNISNVVSNLGNLLRYTVNNRQTSVNLSDEMRFVESYLKIQELRSGDKLRTELYVDPSLEHALVPKLILQPLIENVIEHGMNSDTVTVCLRAKMEGEDLVLTLDDNGGGMDDQTIASVEHRMYSPWEENHEKEEYGRETHGYALRNVHQRIRLLYGEPYGVTIVRKKNQGTTFRIRLPFQWEE